MICKYVFLIFGFLFWLVKELMSETADTAERMELRIMAYVFNKEYGKKYTNNFFFGFPIIVIMS